MYDGKAFSSSTNEDMDLMMSFTDRRVISCDHNGYLCYKHSSCGDLNRYCKRCWYDCRKEGNKKKMDYCTWKRWSSGCGIGR